MSAAKKKKSTGKTTAKKTSKKTTAKKVAKKAAKTAKKSKKTTTKAKATKSSSKKVAAKKTTTKKAKTKKVAAKKTVTPKAKASASKQPKATATKKTKASASPKTTASPKATKKTKAVKETPKSTKATKVSAKVTKPKKAEEAKATSKVDTKTITEGLVKTENQTKIAEVLLTDAEGRVLCRFAGCDAPALVESYCRYHYLLNWKKIQLRKKILAEGKLENYINELTARYPDKYLEMMKSDLKTEKDFLAAVQELEIDDPDAAMSDSDAENYLEEVRGIRGENRGSSEDDY